MSATPEDLKEWDGKWEGHPPIVLAALSYAARGWAVVPVKARGKVPIGEEWQKLRLTPEEIPRRFHPDSNVGVILGEASSLNDIDLDCPEARRLAPEYLSPTLTFGRASAPRSHWIYTERNPGPTQQFRDPMTNEMIIELRGTPGQTVFPGSTHESGESIEFDDPEAIPATCPDLRSRVAMLACEVLAERYGEDMPPKVDAKIREWLGEPPPRAPGSEPKSAPRPSHRPDVIERARSYLARIPGAVIKKGGDHQTWLAALHLVKGFGLDEGTALSLLLSDYNPRCEPPWTVKALEHKVRDAARARAESGFHVNDDPAAPPPSNENGASPDWPEPQPLPSTRPAVPPMDPELLPAAFRPWLEDIAMRTQTPLEYGAVSAMVALSAVVGRTLGIRPKRKDNWLVIPNLWGGVVGPPGVMKTPVQTQAMVHIRRLEAEKLAAHAIKVAEKESTFAKIQRESEMKALKKAVEGCKETITHGGVEIDVKERLDAIDQEEKPDPEPRKIVNDITVEALGVKLQENPNGLLMFRDEMMGWVKSLEKEGHESARQNYLECWNGDGEFVYDRIGRGTTRIRGACVSVLGSVQPGPLAGLLQGAADNGAEADGFTARFQLLVYPDLPDVVPEIDEWPNTAAKNLAWDVFKALDTLDPKNRSAQYDGDSDPPWLHFDDDAQPVVLNWLTWNKRRARSEDVPEVLRAHLSKYASLMPSLALLCHLADTAITTGPLRPVSLEATTRAIRWCELLEAHARRVYAPVLQGDACTAALIAEKLKARAVVSPFTAKDVWRPQWSGLTNPERVAEALALLESLGWLRSEEQPPNPKGGKRPATLYHVNPTVVGG